MTGRWSSKNRKKKHNLFGSSLKKILFLYFYARKLLPVGLFSFTEKRTREKIKRHCFDGLFSGSANESCCWSLQSLKKKKKKRNKLMKKRNKNKERETKRNGKRTDIRHIVFEREKEGVRRWRGECVQFCAQVR